MAGYRRVMFNVDKKEGVIHLGFLKEIREIYGKKYPIYDGKVIGKDTTEKLYNELKKLYEVKEPN